MPRLNPIQPDRATGKAKELLDGAQAELKINVTNKDLNQLERLMRGA